MKSKGLDLLFYLTAIVVITAMVAITLLSFVHASEAPGATVTDVVIADE